MPNANPAKVNSGRAKAALGGAFTNPSSNIFCTFAFEGAEMSLSTAVTISKTVTRAERDECVAFPKLCNRILAAVVDDAVALT